MRVAVTGTPGTGKTTAVDMLAELLETPLDAVHLNDVVREEGLVEGTDEERDSLVVDVEATREWLTGREDVVFESHLAHLFEADRVVVLRCHPADLERRLRDRGETEAKAHENAEAEALDVVLAEAVDRHGEASVYEIDTTDRTPEQVAEDLVAVVRGERSPAAGGVDFTGWLA